MAELGKQCVLLTGGAGFIGTHTAVEVLKAGYEVVIIDNLHNSCIDSIGVVEDLAGVPHNIIARYIVDIVNEQDLRQVFQKHKFDFVIHFAGLKAVGESCHNPMLYYRNNLRGSITLLEVMKEFGVTNIVFSSSSTVYGIPDYLPLVENHPTGRCTNPYGRTKYMIEEILKDMVSAEKDWHVVSLRYFNPVGAHESGRLGEDPLGIPNNLMPYIAQVAVGRRSHLNVYGTDYDTHDGTGVRDYIHVVDLAVGHLMALNKLKESCGFKAYNLGICRGYSVMDMIKAFEKASGKSIPYQNAERRIGDVDQYYADPGLANTEMGWKAVRGLDDMCVDAWRWQSLNPTGFKRRDSE